MMKNLMSSAYSKYGQLALRLAVGAVFIFHGAQKLFTQTDGIAGFFDQIGIPMANLAVYLVGGVEFFGGILLILGLFTRIAALGHAAVMVVAILVAKGLESWTAIEFDVTLLAASIMFVLSGPGELSMDMMMNKNKSMAVKDMSMKEMPKNMPDEMQKMPGKK